MDHLNFLNLNCYNPVRAADVRLTTGATERGFEQLATLTVWTGSVTLTTYPDAKTLRALAAGATAAAEALEPGEQQPAQPEAAQEVVEKAAALLREADASLDHRPEFRRAISELHTALAKHGSAA